MAEPSNYCPLCGGEKGPGTTTFTVDLGFGVVVIREVPAWVCAQCGEVWLEDGVAEKLEALVADARHKHTVVEVARWPDVAA